MQNDDYCYYIHACAGVFTHDGGEEGFGKKSKTENKCEYLAMVYLVRNKIVYSIRDLSEFKTNLFHAKVHAH